MNKQGILQPPLAGIRVIDFTWAAAGPFATLMMGFLGAEVVKVESEKRLDLLRKLAQVYGRAKSSEVSVEQSPEFNDLNLNKLGIRLDMQNPASIELVKQLVAVSDVVVANFSAGVLQRLKLDYVALRTINPSIIVASLSSGGSGGPEYQQLGYAPIFSAQGGTANLAGYADEPPIPTRGASDMVSGSYLALAITAALNHRSHTGQGQFIDVAAIEGIAMLVGETVVDFSMTGHVAHRRGNEDNAIAPHNCYPCLGDDRWVSIVASTDAEWEALCGAIGRPAWCHDPRFAAALSRWEHRDELDNHLAAWTRSHPPEEITAVLQNVGVAAFPVMSIQALAHDPHLRDRRFYDEVNHPVMGPCKVAREPWVLAETPPSPLRPGPTLGQHEVSILQDLLGHSEAEVALLRDSKVLT